MEFKFVTEYSTKTLTEMAKVIRKTSRKKRNLIIRIAGIILIILAILLVIPSEGEVFVLDFRNLLMIIAVLMLGVVLLFEDKLNGYIAKKRMLPSVKTATATFGDENYLIETEIGKTEFKYEAIVSIAETEGYYVFVFSQMHAQIYKKSTLAGGSEEEFEAFITEKTGKSVKRL